MVLQDNEHREVNDVPVKAKTVLPILLQNGNCVQDAQNDTDKSSCDGENDSGKQIISEFKTRLKFLRVNDQVKELQTTLRDRYEWAVICRPNIKIQILNSRRIAVPVVNNDLTVFNVF